MRASRTRRWRCSPSPASAPPSWPRGSPAAAGAWWWPSGWASRTSEWSRASPRPSRRAAGPIPTSCSCSSRAVPAGKGGAWPARRGPARWALPETAFEHRGGMITKAEVRALALARLGPGVGDLVWDVGAGSGSVGVECARLGAAVIAVDRDPLACKLVAANAERHGVAVQVVGGTAPEALVALPYPDAVFVGGGGDALEAVLRLATARTRRVVVVALTGADGHTRPGRVLLAARTLAAAGMDVETVRLHASRFQTTTELRESLATNPVYLVSGTRP